MNNLPRQILRDLITRYGVELLDNPLRVQGFLADLCPGEYRREKHVLLFALQKGIVSEIQSTSSLVPLEVLLSKLTQRLVEDYSLSEMAACWTVESWALALGKLTAAERSSTLAVSEPSIPTLALQSETRVNPVDGAEMLWILEGEFLMGDGDQGDNPRHTVNLSGFWMYKNLVTVEMYNRFCKATSRKMPSAPKWGGQSNHPMVMVGWEDAKAYADWADVSLPTEAQWEKAARGTDGRLWPWGNQWDESKLWCSVRIRRNGTAPVGQYGMSPYGCTDMAGNIRQWCSDKFNADYYKWAPDQNPTGPLSGIHRVLRGGSWNDDNKDEFCASYRKKSHPDSRGGLNGFRCISERKSHEYSSNVRPNGSNVGHEIIIMPPHGMDKLSEEVILVTIEKIYAEAMEYFILVSDQQNNEFMQLVPFHIEYCVSPRGPVYSFDSTSIELAKELFLSYARADDKWRTAVQWKVEVERL